jgi:hypothetical protein
MLLIAAGFIVIPVTMGMRSDGRVEEFLNKPGVIETFEKSNVSKNAKTTTAKSAIERQAESFAKYLNPPAPKQSSRPKTTKTSPRTQAVRPKTVNAKFELVGTSFHSSNPSLSLALIDEPGKGKHWVKQSDKVGHLVIEEIKNGVVVIKDGTRTYDMAAQKPKRLNLLKGATDQQTQDTSGGFSGKPKVEGIRSRYLEKIDANTEKPLPSLDTEIPQDTTVENTQQELFNTIKAFSELLNQDRQNSDENTDNALSNVLSNLEQMRLKAAEAKKLEMLGEKLDKSAGEPNSSVPTTKSRPTPSRNRPRPTRRRSSSSKRR